MRIKHAYNTLVNPDSRTRYDSRDRKSDFSYSSAGRGQGTQEEEEFYGLGTSLSLIIYPFIFFLFFLLGVSKSTPEVLICVS